ncbi:MAG: asparagine synthase (glutamine-hydrolyzing) [Kiritimatiellae bacterium]|nr:asparagine synthase (glutamine-hydrolyzing) [Kiritimatiellia bacterium]
MCGIIGIFERNSQPDQVSFRAALKSLSKRGPDGEGVVELSNAILGHRRLSIRNAGNSGAQPMTTPDGAFTIVYDGALYNDIEIKESITPQPVWRSRSDGEVVLHAFAKHGASLCNKLNGMFALAVYDKDRSQVTLARDHFGKKPLYYYHDDNCFAFASELKALLPIIKKHTQFSVNSEAVPKYLIYGYVPGEDSCVTGIKRLAPSTALTFDLSNWRVLRKLDFWKPECIGLNTGISYDEAVEESEHLIDRAIKCRLVNDAPTSVFLSGGVDSSAVAAFAAKYVPNMQAHSIVYPELSSIDESKYAHKVAHSLGLPYNPHPFQDHDVVSTFSSLLDYMDEPLADGALIPLHFLSKQTASQAPVALTGDGGDELFGGYVKHRAQRLAEGVPSCLRALSGFIGAQMPSGQISRLLTTLPYPFFARQYLWGSGSPLPHVLKQWMPDAEWSNDAVFSDVLNYDACWQQRDNLNRSLFLDWRILLPDGGLFKSDRASMAASLEMRSPLLDKDLAEFVISLPGRLKLKKGSKSILKETTAKYVPNECVYRKKLGFAVPMDQWLRNELRAIVEPLLLEKETPFFSKNEILRAWQEHQTGNCNHSFVLFRIALFNKFFTALNSC